MAVSLRAERRSMRLSAVRLPWPAASDQPGRSVHLRRRTGPGNFHAEDPLAPMFKAFR